MSMKISRNSSSCKRLDLNTCSSESAYALLVSFVGIMYTLLSGADSKLNPSKHSTELEILSKGRDPGETYLN